MDQTHPIPVAATGVAPQEQPISLKIAGADILLNGQFDHWVPMALVGEGDAGGVAQLLLDATSPTRRRTPARQELLSFVSTSAKEVSPRVYTAKGVLRAGGAQRTVEAVIQTPEGHSPFIFLALPLDRERFEQTWETLERKLGGQASDEVKPRAWLRAPHLAAA